MRIAPFVLTLALVAGCGSDDPSTDLAGIFEVATWTANPDSCAEEGPPAFEATNYTHFFVRMDEILGQSFISVVPCVELEECRMNAAETDTIFLGSGFILDHGSDGDGWSGTSTYIGGGDTCAGTVETAVLTGESEASVEIRNEIKEVADVPLDDEGFCDSDAAKEQAEDVPCTQLEVVTGTYLESI